MSSFVRREKLSAPWRSRSLSMFISIACSVWTFKKASPVGRRVGAYYASEPQAQGRRGCRRGCDDYVNYINILRILGYLEGSCVDTTGYQAIDILRFSLFNADERARVPRDFAMREIYHSLVLNLHQPSGNLQDLLVREEWEARQILWALDRIPRSLWPYEDIARVHLSLSGTLLETLRDPEFQRRVYGMVDCGSFLWYLQNTRIFEILGNVTECVDCHLPHDNLVDYYIAKARTGIHDVYVFSTGTTPQLIRAKEDTKRIIQSNCIRCHKSTVENIMLGPQTFDRYCWECHRSVAHGQRGISIVPYQDSVLYPSK